MSELGKKGVAAVKWGAISSAGRFVLQLGAGVVLARLLGPDAYGVFGMGLLVFTLSNFLAEFGFGWGLVQRVDLHPDDVRFAFTWQLVTGTAAAHRAAAAGTHAGAASSMMTASSPSSAGSPSPACSMPHRHRR